MQLASMHTPIAVVGAGAAGLMAAIFAARGGRRVVVVESTLDGGRKILISGGGRCNVLPSALDESRFVTDSSPNSLRKILRSWPLAEQRAFFETELALPLRLEADTGKLFPASNRARDVRDALVAEARQRGVAFRCGVRVEALLPPTSSEAPWTLRLADGSELSADAVIVATGGLSVPTTGSDGSGLAWLAALGHRLHPTYPALTPLLQEPPRWASLAGVSLEVTLRATLAKRAYEVRGGFLFTHRGFSGPAVLDLSHLAVRAAMEGRGQEIYVDWANRAASAWDEDLRSARGGVASVLRPFLPERLALALLDEAGIAPDLRAAELARGRRLALVEALTRLPLPWTGNEGYRKAEVTGGGVDLGEVDARTLESRRQPRLFLCGELLDAFGPIGGYNFAWAWATGRAAGIGAAQRR